jgi:hypothetical protein
MAPRPNIYTINQAIEQANRDRRENEARRDAQWRQYRRDADLKSSLEQQDRILRSSIANSAANYKHSSAEYSPSISGSDRRGNSGIITFGIILTLVICGYALAHGVTLVTIIKIAIWIAAAVAVIAIAFAVIAFIRAFAGPIIAIGCVGWYLAVHYHAPATQPASDDHIQYRFAPSAASPSPAPQPAAQPASDERAAHIRYQVAHYEEWAKALGPDRVKQINDSLPNEGLSAVPEFLNRLERAAASLHQ